jgi:hypothetical protein
MPSYDDHPCDVSSPLSFSSSVLLQLRVRVLADVGGDVCVCAVLRPHAHVGALGDDRGDACAALHSRVLGACHDGVRHVDVCDSPPAFFAMRRAASWTVASSPCGNASSIELIAASSQRELRSNQDSLVCAFPSSASDQSL